MRNVKEKYYILYIEAKCHEVEKSYIVESGNRFNFVFDGNYYPAVFGEIINNKDCLVRIKIICNNMLLDTLNNDNNFEIRAGEKCIGWGNVKCILGKEVVK